MTPLKKLDGRALSEIDSSFREGNRAPDFTELVSGFDRHESETGDLPQVMMDPLETAVEQAMSRFDVPTRSDPWLAKRLHSILRLYRREAADTEIWNYLSVVAFPRYVRWRWAQDDGSPPASRRFIGGRTFEQAFSRLWWWAEMTWNGNSYDAVDGIFQSSDLVKFGNYRCFRHRPAAIAVARFTDSADPTSDQAQDFGRHFNFFLTTHVLDSISENTAHYSRSDLGWYAAGTKDRQDCIENPVAPGTNPVPEQEIESVVQLLYRVADSVEGLSLNLQEAAN
ncbi:DUF6339 family protein [Salinibacter ruber]|uniref:DUF6339 family protein n=1 Tax=Salinibacter ruber TaxID=146919 RepID=UPI002073A0BE|nr:DUF6339 family protein [Salinibacter ruber]